MKVLIVREKTGRLTGLFCRDQQDEKYHLKNGAFEKEIVTTVDFSVDRDLKAFNGIMEALCRLDGAMLQRLSMSDLLGLLVSFGFEAGRKFEQGLTAPVFGKPGPIDH